MTTARPLHKSLSKRATLDTCEEYSRMIAAGGDPAEIVTGLACCHSVNRSAIWKRLRAGGVLPPYQTNSNLVRKRRTTNEIHREMESQHRIDRDPCPRCGVRGDIGCKHTRAPIGMQF